MTQAISRETFNELNNYLGVYLQQGRAILDSDWNENQDIAVSFMRRLGREAFGDGSPNSGFSIEPVFPPPPSLILSTVDTTGMDFEEAIGAIIGACFADLMQIMFYVLFGPLLFFLDFPGEELDTFESAQGWALNSPQGALRIGRDRPAAGDGFLRVSGHAGTVQLKKTLPGVIDISDSEFAIYKFRLNRQTPGPIKFFLEDIGGNRSVWTFTNAALARDLWMSGIAAPLELRFHVLTDSLPPGAVGDSYGTDVTTFGAAAPVTWTISAGALPAGLSIATNDEKNGRISGTPTTVGTSTFTVQGTDADGGVTTRQFTLEIAATPSLDLPLPGGLIFLAQLAKTETVNGPADLTQIKAYGFEVYQDGAAPLVFDFDELRLGSSALEHAIGTNNFIIRGSDLNKIRNQLTMTGLFAGGEGDDDEEPTETTDNLLSLLNADFDLFEPTVESAGRYYVAGLSCLQIEDVLYSDQADPNDPPLQPPPPGTKRKDMVYLDAWTEPLTYVDEPSIREIALGGPDTATRRTVRHRVRVAQGAPVPIGDGIGEGTLATEGIYTAQENRLYRVEIDKPGNIGTARFRWSRDNASTLQRVIAPVPPGSTKLVVEDASTFRIGDLVLLRKEFGAEKHQIADILGNVITLVAPTGTQLATLPAAASDPGFTTFTLDDRPSLQRWDAFGVSIPADPADATISSALPLGSDGVAVRFGGRDMVVGDHWTFNTRYLAGEESSGISPVTRIERVDWRRARGVRHHFAPLATITRDGDASDPDMIFIIEDRRLRTGGSSTTTATLPDLTALTGDATTYIGGMRLPPSTLESRFLINWSGDLYLPTAATGTLQIRVSFYSEDADPANDDATGKIQDREVSIKLDRRATGVDIPLSLQFAKSDLSFDFLPVESFVPASVHLFAKLSEDTDTIGLSSMRLLALELKKGH